MSENAVKVNAKRNNTALKNGISLVARFTGILGSNMTTDTSERRGPGDDGLEGNPTRNNHISNRRRSVVDIRKIFEEKSKSKELPAKKSKKKRVAILQSNPYNMRSNSSVVILLNITRF